MQNQQISEFQTKFPLSVRRKFWKKMITSVFGYYIFSMIIFGPMLAVLVVSLPSIPNVSYNSSAMIALSLFSFPFILLLLIALFRGWYLKYYIKYYYYSADQDFLTIKKGVFGPREIHVQYRKIQDVYVDQDILDRIMGLYDVHIASATVASGMEAHIDGVNEVVAKGLKDFLLNSIKSVPYSTGNGYSPTQNVPLPVPPPPPSL